MKEKRENKRKTRETLCSQPFHLELLFNLNHVHLQLLFVFLFFHDFLHFLLTVFHLICLLLDFHLILILHIQFHSLIQCFLFNLILFFCDIFLLPLSHLQNVLFDQSRLHQLYPSHPLHLLYLLYHFHNPLLYLLLLPLH
jgi:hypothetical protein